MTFTRILVPTDFGAESKAALGAAASLARPLNASIELLHVARDPYLALSTPELYGIDWAKVRADMIADSRRRLEDVADTVKDVVVVPTVVFGRPAETIAEIARRRHADLIVMGTHGRGAVGHLLIGSVAERVIRLARCPVMTVRDFGAVHLATPEGAAREHQPAQTA